MSRLRGDGPVLETIFRHLSCWTIIRPTNSQMATETVKIANPMQPGLKQGLFKNKLAPDSHESLN